MHTECVATTLKPDDDEKIRLVIAALKKRIMRESCRRLAAMGGTMPSWNRFLEGAPLWLSDAVLRIAY